MIGSICGLGIWCNKERYAYDDYYTKNVRLAFDCAAYIVYEFIEL